MVSEGMVSTRSLDAEFLRKLEQLAIVAKRVRLGTAKGERKSKRKGISVEFADYRDYVQGDDLRHVDWNIYGRLDALYLKLFQEQEDLTVHLLLDASRSMAFGHPPKMAFACKLAAAIGYIALVGYERVSMEASSVGQDDKGRPVQRLHPCRGKASVTKLFAFIESVRAHGPTRLESFCRSYALRNRSKGVTVLFSDFLDPEGFEAALKRLAHPGTDLFAVHILSREELDPNVSGDLKLLDCETNAATEISVSAVLMKRYRANVRAFCEGIRQFCTARGIGYVLAPSDAPFEKLILEALRKGGMLR